VYLDPATGLTAPAVIEALLAGDPAVAVMGFDPRGALPPAPNGQSSAGRNGQEGAGPPAEPWQVVRVDVRILSDAETEQVIGRLREVLAPRAAAVAG
jgi:hypothetical protein